MSQIIALSELPRRKILARLGKREKIAHFAGAAIGVPYDKPVMDKSPEIHEGNAVPGALGNSGFPGHSQAGESMCRSSESRYSGCLAALLAIGIAGCGASPGEDPVEEVKRTPSGSLTLRITDSPVDFAEHVFVQVRGIQLQAGSGGGTTFYYCRDAVGARVVQRTDCAQRAPLSFDLLALTDGVSDVLLGDQVVDAGSYSWVRLLVDAEPGVRDSYIVMAGAEYELMIPSGVQSGLKVNRGFEVSENGSADFTIDFDLRTSIAAPKSGTVYILRPTLRLVDSFASGAIAGTVDTSWMTVACNKAVIYAYSGANVTPDDIDKLDADPVASGRVRLDGGSGSYRYKVAFLEPGNYTVAFLCQGAGDDPDKSDALIFTGATNAVVNAGKTTTVHFEP